jgi:hypothetical protein
VRGGAPQPAFSSCFQPLQDGPGDEVGVSEGSQWPSARDNDKGRGAFSPDGPIMNSQVRTRAMTITSDDGEPYLTYI